MGRPIKKKWFTAYGGSDEGNLQVTTTAGAEEIIKQVGSGVYEVGSGRVKLFDGTPAQAADPANGIVGDAQLVHNGRNVRRINQYRLTYFDDGDSGTKDDAVWRDRDGMVVGTFTPPLSGEDGGEPGTPPAQASATAILNLDVVESITVDDGGAGYETEPTVTITGDGTGATATAVIDEDGVVTAINVTDGGTGYSTATVVISAPGETGPTDSDDDCKPKAKAKKKKKKFF